MKDPAPQYDLFGPRVEPQSPALPPEKAVARQEKKPNPRTIAAPAQDSSAGPTARVVTESEAAAPAPPLPEAPSPKSRVYTVSELTSALKGTLEARFPRVLVRGEMSNLRRHGSGHVYFGLKDEGAKLSAVMFRTDASRLGFALRDGLAVVARGRISVYEPRGEYELICDALEPEGAGARALALEALKSRLGAEGLFAEARKRPLPFIASRVGVATSKRGAALADFLRVLSERFPVPVLVADCRVQGEGAATEIANAIRRLSESGRVDVIVVTRGGGSTEDLWAFNEEAVVRAIAASSVPVVSAVGHEVDVTLADFAADRRAATPTHAAKEVVPSRIDLLQRLGAFRPRLLSAARRVQLSHGQRLRLLQTRLVHPGRRIAERRLRLDDLADRAAAHLRGRVQLRRSQLADFSKRLAALHPQAGLGRHRATMFELERNLHRFPMRIAGMRGRLESLRTRLERRRPGNALVFRGDHVVSSVADVSAGEEIRVRLADGAFDATIKTVTSD